MRGWGCCGRLFGNCNRKNHEAAEPLAWANSATIRRCRFSRGWNLNNQEESMLTSWMRRYYWAIAVVIAMAVSVVSAKAPAPELNPAAISYKLPNQVNWVHGANGADTAVLAGDPAKPGMYI